MNTMKTDRRRRGRWVAPCSVAALLVALTPWGGHSPAQAAPFHAQPALLQLAAQHPQAMVRVIVQQARPATGADRLIQSLGGRVTRNLPIIDALVATLPAHTIPQVAAANGVRWISMDGPVASSGTMTPSATGALQNVYIPAIGADRLRAETPSLDGRGIGVAVVDSGINGRLDDLQDGSGHSRVVDQATFSTTMLRSADRYGHGTHVAGIIGGNGADSGGAYAGVAPGVNLIDVKVSDFIGAASESDVVAGLQWVYDHAAADNIRVVNLSLNTTTAQSYNVDPLDAACEILWNHKIVVVTSAGNNANTTHGVLYPPANDPFVITVGAVDDKGTPSTADDSLATFSASGTTPDGVSKPDLVAPGVNIVSTLASMGTVLAVTHRDHVVTPQYFRMSGTSVSAPIVSGAAALLLQSNPALTPDQVKYRLTATARPIGTGTGAGELDAYAALHSGTTASANTGVVPSRLIGSGNQTAPFSAWDSVSWSSVSWSSVSWSSVSWSSVSWSSDYWGS